MKIAITGATGFIGRHLVKKLTEKGFNDLKILACDDVSFLKKQIPSLNIIKGDLLKKETLNNFVKDVDLIIHLAGTFFPPLEDLINLNVIATLNLLEVCREQGVDKIIFISSGVAYGEPPIDRASIETDKLNPNAFYGLTKKIAESVLDYYDNNFNIRFVILRFSSVYGTGNNKGVVYNFLKSINKKNRIIISGDGEQARDFLFAEDAVSAIAKVVNKYNFSKSEVFNVATGKKTTLNQLAQIFKDLVPVDVNITYRESDGNNLRVLWEDISKIQKSLNWQPKFSLEEGLKTIIRSLHNVR